MDAEDSHLPALALRFQQAGQVLLSTSVSLDQLQSFDALLSCHSLALSKVLGVSGGNAKSLLVGTARTPASPGVQQAIAFWDAVVYAVKWDEGDDGGRQAQAVVECCLDATPTATQQRSRQPASVNDEEGRFPWIHALQRILSQQRVMATDLHHALRPVPPLGVSVSANTNFMPAYATTNPPRALTASPAGAWAAKGREILLCSRSHSMLSATLPKHSHIHCMCPGEDGSVTIVAGSEGASSLALWRAAQASGSLSLELQSQTLPPCRKLAAIGAGCLLLLPSGCSR